MSQQDQLLDAILSGQNRQLQLLAAQGLVPLPPEQLLGLQVALTGSPDAEVAGAARQALVDGDPGVVGRFLAEAAGAAELEWFATHATQPQVLEALVRRRDAPLQALVRVAPRLSPEQQEVLVLRQDAILEEPEILVALEGNPELSAYVKRRIWEYREHLLPRDKVPPKSDAELVAEAEGLTDAELAEAIDEARSRQTDDDGKEKDERSGLSEGQIRALPVPVRIRLARGATRQMRNTLIRDSNSQVALAVITGNQLADQEVEQIAANRAVVPEVLREILRRREWIRKYNVVKALVKNPRVELSVAVRLVPQLSVRDLRELARDRNIADGVRQMARRLWSAKQK